jgi:hypothetical protein
VSVLEWAEIHESFERDHGKLLKKEVFEFPLAKNVTLSKGEIRTSTWHAKSIIVRTDRFPSLYDLLGAYYKGTQISNRETKYRNLYQVYEALSEAPDQELKAIRHSFSHAREKLTSKKTVEILHSLFGDTKINLHLRKHSRVFYEKYKQLKEESEPLLVKKILEITPSSPNFQGQYYMP